MAVLYTNNAASLLSASITDAATSFSVTNGQGALFPALTGSDYFYVTLLDTAGNIEIVKVTGRSADTFTVTRGQDGTSARAWAVGDKVELRIVRAMLDDLKGERLPLTGGTLTGTDVVLTIRDDAASNDGSWRGRIVSKNVTSGVASFLGNYQGKAGVYAHSAALDAWADLYVNTSNGSGGGAVRMTTSVFMGGNQALHAGNYTDYAMPSAGPSTGSNGRILINASGNPVWSDITFTYDAVLGSFRAANLRAAIGDSAPTWNFNNILHAGNYSSYAAPASHTHSYLPLSGGTVTGAINLGASDYNRPAALVMASDTNWTYGSASDNSTYYYMQVQYHAGGGNTWNRGFRVYDVLNGVTVFQASDLGSKINGNIALHAGNYSSYALPLTGGTLASGADQLLTLNKTAGSAWNYIGFSVAGTRRFYFGLNASYEPELGADNGGTFRVLGPMSVGGSLLGTAGAYFRKAQTAGDYTTAALWTESYDNTTTGIAFHISGVVGKYLEMRTNGTLYWNSDAVLHSGNYSSYALPLGGGTLTGSLTVGRDVVVVGQTGGNYGNRIVVGAYNTSYTLQDGNQRPTIQANGAYPVLSLNHTVTSNSNHGPTIQMTANGVGNQFVIGMTGNGTALDMGYSSTSDWNPHNGIAGYSGTTFFRANSSGYVGIGAPGNWGGIGGGDPGYHLHVKGYSTATNGYAGVFQNTTNGANNGGGWLFQNDFANHSWGATAEFRVNSTGDRPSIIFSTAAANTSWSIGYVTGSDDSFRISKNHGHRAYYGGWADAAGGWGAEYFKITNSGATYANGGLLLSSANYTNYAAPISHSHNYLPSNADSNMAEGVHGGSINGTNMQAWLAPNQIQNHFAFNAPTSYEYWDGSSWVAGTVPTNIFQNKSSGAFDGFGIPNGRAKIRFTWMNFGYKYWRSLATAGSTNGNGFKVRAYKSSDGTNWTAAFADSDFRGDWPGYHIYAYQDNMWGSSHFRLEFEFSWNNGNACNFGDIALWGAYGGYNPLFDWNYNRDVGFYGIVGAYRNDLQRVFETYNTSAGSPTQFYIEHYYGDVNIGNARGALKLQGYVGLHAGNYSSYALPLSGGTMSGAINMANNGVTYANQFHLNNGFSITQGASSYGQFSSWVHLPGYHGLYSAQNGAHFYPNPGTYGAWHIAGSRNGWNGLEFSASAGNINLMIGNGSNETGFHNTSYGWQFMWTGGTLYVYKNTYGGGTGAAVLDSSNYTNYTLPIGGGWYGSGLPGSRWGGYSVNGGEISFGRDLPNNGQMGILVDGCYVAGENNGFWSLGNDNTWGSRRGMYWDGSYLNFTTNTPAARFQALYIDGGGTYLGVNYFLSNKGASTYVGGQNNYSLQAFSNDAGAAGMSFHRGGYYAVNMGLDPDNVLRIGGWSANANLWQLDMSGNNYIAGNMNATNHIGSKFIALYGNPNDTVDGAPWYGLGAATGLFSGNDVVHLGGYYGLRFRTASAYLDLYMGSAYYSATFNAATLQNNGNQVLHAGNVSSYAIPLTSGSITTYAYVSFNSGFSASSNAYFSSGVYQTVNGIANTDYSNTVSPSLNSINNIASHTYAGKTHVGLNQTAAKRRAQALAGSGGTFGTTYGYLIDEIYVNSSLNAYTVMQQNSWSFISSYATGSLNRHFYVGAESIGPGSSQYDNLMSAGASSARYTIVYATTGTINTSDVNEKEQIQDLDAAERRVAVAVKGLIKKFKWKDAVAKKGDAARIHIGVIAQEVEAAFVAEGLDPERYALFCKDVWWEKMVPNENYGREDAPNEPEMILETFQSEVEGGTRKERKGIRYDQLLAFVISAI